MKGNKLRAQEFGNNVKRIRNVLGMSQEELAGRADLHPAAIGHYEIGSREPSLTNIIKLCYGLGCKPNVLITFPAVIDL